MLWEAFIIEIKSCWALVCTCKYFKAFTEISYFLHVITHLSVNIVHWPYHNQLSLKIHPESHIIYGLWCGLVGVQGLDCYGTRLCMEFWWSKVSYNKLNNTYLGIGKNVGQGQLMTIQILATKPIVRKPYTQRGLHPRNLVFHS